jgi:hypothetical protein
MTIFEYNRPRAGLFYSLLKMDKKVRNNALIVILVGVFLLPKTAHLSTISEAKIVELTNKERISAGLPSLAENARLYEAAKAKAAAILETGDFSHAIGERRFSSWVKDAGYEYSIVGENLAIDFISSEGVLKAWRGSPSHLKNILSDKYQDIGVAVVEGVYQGQQTIVVAQIFGAPAQKQTQDEVVALSESQNEKTYFKDLLPWLAIKLLSGRLAFPVLSMLGKDAGLSLLALAKN